MADYTYQTRRKMTEDWVAHVKEKAGHLSKNEKQLLPGAAYHSVAQAPQDWMRGLFDSGKYQKLSDLYRGELPGLVKACVPEKLTEEFYYALDQMNQFQMTAGWYRRSVRSDSYRPFVYQSVQLLWAYARLEFYGGSLADILTGRIDPEQYDHARTERWSYAEMLAAQIDRKEEATIQAVKDILLGEGNTLMISHKLIRGIVMSKNTELYEILGKYCWRHAFRKGRGRLSVRRWMQAARRHFCICSVSLKKITWYDILPLNGQSAPGSESLMKKVRSVSLKSWFV